MKDKKYWVKTVLLVFFALLVGYGFITGSITGETIVELFKGFAAVSG